MRRVLALDLDGTLTTSDKRVTTRTKEVLRRMQALGHIVVLASGRPVHGAMPVAEELNLQKSGGYLISYNGAVILDCRTGEYLHRETLPEELVREVFELADELGMGMMFYQRRGIVAGIRYNEHMEYASKINHLEIIHSENPLELMMEPVSKCLGTVSEEMAPQVTEVFREKFGDRATVIRSEPFFVEVLPRGADKAQGLAVLLEKLGISRENVIACGDGFNDISMVRYAGLGVAMANAQEPVKEAADIVTLSNDEDGVARVVEEYLL